MRLTEILGIGLELRYIVVNFVPGRLRADENMMVGLHARIVIQRTGRDPDPLRHAFDGKREFRSASRAKRTLREIRGCVALNAVRAFHDAQVRSRNLAIGRESRPVLLAAHAAMTMTHTDDGRSDLQGYRTAKAAAVNHLTASAHTFRQCNRPTPATDPRRTGISDD